MTGKKHERDGESYIVSDGVNLDELDLENMTQNEVQVPEILRTHFAQPPSIESIPGMIPQVQQNQERIWLEITVESNDDLVQFPGYLEESKFSSDGVSYTLKMDRKSAAELMMVASYRTQFLDKSLYCAQLKWVYGEDEKVLKFPKYKPIHGLEMEDKEETETFVNVKLVI